MQPESLSATGFHKPTLMKPIERILLIDDDKDDRELFAAAIYQLDKDINCNLCRSGEVALQKLNDAEHPLPDLIFIDINMPGMNGYDVLVALKASERLRHIPAVIYSTFVTPKVGQRVMEAGAAAFISKAGTYDGLINQLKEAIIPYQVWVAA